MGDILFVDPESRAVRGLDHSSVQHQRTGRATVAHVEAAAVDRADHVHLAPGLHCLRLLGGLDHRPLVVFDVTDVVVAVARRDRRGRILSYLDLHDVTHHLLGQ